MNQAKSTTKPAAAEVRQEQHRNRQDVRGIHGRGTRRHEGAPPGTEGSRPPRPAPGQGGRGKRSARQDRRDAGTGSRHRRAAHAIIKASAQPSRRFWYGMPAYARDGKVVCFFQSAEKFKTRYATLGFSDTANLDEGALWPVAFALKELTAAAEAKIGALVKKAVS